jgi:16S rRNA (guanine527-N7)-methyltransferase
VKNRSAASSCFPTDVPGELPEPLADVAAAVFGPELPRASRYAELLATDGLVRGLLGPREADRIWDRHLLNSAVLGEIVDADTTVTDVGSGAGLPGVPLALARPDLRVLLLEPMLRRITFLEEVVAELGLEDRVVIVRGRAPDAAATVPFSADYVTARAVAPLERLVSWTMPFVRVDGALLALRGASAPAEAQEADAAVRALAGSAPELLSIGGDRLAEPVTVVRVVRRTGDADAGVPAAVSTAGTGRERPRPGRGPAASRRRRSR